MTTLATPPPSTSTAASLPVTDELFSNIDTYLGRFVSEMADKLDGRLDPLFDTKKDELSPEVLDLLDCGMKPYPAQAVAVEAMLRLFRDQKMGWLVGEMGTGKTPLALWIIAVQEKISGKAQRVVLTAPNQLVRKWKRHAEMILPSANVTIVRDWRELRRYIEERTELVKEIEHDEGGPTSSTMWRWMDPEVTDILIMARDRGKLGYAWSLGVNERKRIKHFNSSTGPVSVVVDHYHCPDCGGLILDNKNNTAGPDFFLTKTGKLKTRQFCDHLIVDQRAVIRDRQAGKEYDKTNPPMKKCGAALWQAYNGQDRHKAHDIEPNQLKALRFLAMEGGGLRIKPVGHSLPMPKISPRRVAPCSMLRQMGYRCDWYISDELHELKGKTLQGQMFADLVHCADKTLGLTGTLTGGYADNLLNLLWRSTPHILVGDGLTHNSSGEDDFVQRYGVLCKETRYVAQNSYDRFNDLVLGRGKKTSSRVKSLPGISPVFFTNFMMDKAVFIRLQEMHEHLPGFDERVHVVPMTVDQDIAMALMQHEYKKHRDAHKPVRCWSAARAVFLRWLDKPWGPSFDIYDRDDEGNPIFAFNVPQLEMKEYPKERRIRRLCTRNRLRGRKTWVFTELTGMDGTPAWDWMEYLSAYLAGYGMKCAVLRSQGTGGPKPEDREAWIDKQVAAGVDVIISNPALVQTGLDLFAFPSIVYAFPGDKTYVLRQASRRAWRLGQTHDCEVDYLVYSGTMSKSVQEAALSLMAAKMASSLALEGDFSSDGLSAMAGGEDIASQLAKFIDGKLEVENVKDAFSRYREQLSACMPTTHTRPEAPVPAPPTEEKEVVEPEVEDEAAITEPVESHDVDWFDPIAIVTQSGDHDEVPIKSTPATSAASFEQPSRVIKSEPRSVRERKAQRLRALKQRLGEPAQSSGDWHCFNGTWYQLVAKRRETVRARNFEQIAEAHPDALIAFVEPADEVGPTTSADQVTEGGVQYVLSFLSVSQYMEGQRTTLSIEQWRGGQATVNELKGRLGL